MHFPLALRLYFILFYFFEAFTNTSEIPEDVYHYFLPLTKIFLKPQLFSFQRLLHFTGWGKSEPEHLT